MFKVGDWLTGKKLNAAAEHRVVIGNFLFASIAPSAMGVWELRAWVKIHFAPEWVPGLLQVEKHIK